MSTREKKNSQLSYFHSHSIKCSLQQCIVCGTMVRNCYSYKSGILWKENDKLIAYSQCSPAFELEYVVSIGLMWLAFTCSIVSLLRPSAFAFILIFLSFHRYFAAAIVVVASACPFSNHNLHFEHTHTVHIDAERCLPDTRTHTQQTRRYDISLKLLASVHLQWEILWPFIFSLQHLVGLKIHFTFILCSIAMCVCLWSGWYVCLLLRICCSLVCWKWYSLAEGIKLQFRLQSDSRNLVCSSSMSINVMC